MALQTARQARDPFRFAAAALFTAMIAHPSWAQPAAGDALELPSGAMAVEDGVPRAVATLLVDAAAVRPGDRVRVGVHLAMDEHWHVYWRNPGQSGYATEIEFRGEGEFEALRWPAPSVFVTTNAQIMTYGYEGEVVLSTWWTVPNADATSLTLRAMVDVLVCRVDCIPGSAELTTEVAVAARTLEPTAAVRSQFDAAEAALPKSAESLGWTLEFALDREAIPPSTEFRLAIGTVACSTAGEDCPGLDAATATFVPDRVPQIAWERFASRPHPSGHDGVAVDVVGRSNPDTPTGDARLGGVLLVDGRDGRRYAMEVEAVLPRVAAGSEVALTPHPLLATSDAAAPLFAAAAPNAGPQETAPSESTSADGGVPSESDPSSASAHSDAGGALAPHAGERRTRSPFVVALPLIAMVPLAFLAWRRYRAPHAPALVLFAGSALAAFLGLESEPARDVGLGDVSPSAGAVPTAFAAVGEVSTWAPWSSEAVSTAVTNGRVAFVDFTADWCVSCKVNERTVLNDARVREAMQRHGVVPFVADWTDGGAPIGDELARFGKSGVPLYLLYSPTSPEDPRVLPELLTIDGVIEAIAEAAAL